MAQGAEGADVWGAANVERVGASLDLKDASSSAALWGMAATSSSGSTPTSRTPASFFLSYSLFPLPIPLLLGLNLFLLAIRIALLFRSHLTTALRRQVVGCSGFPPS